ncbi:MAG: hypothetical protein V4603_03780 [Pseudomonadota bacterium]
MLATISITFAQPVLTPGRMPGAEAGRSQAMLRTVLRQLPQGADSHNHGSSRIFAEDILALAAAKDTCLTPTIMVLTAPPYRCRASTIRSPRGGWAQSHCIERAASRCDVGMILPELNARPRSALMTPQNLLCIVFRYKQLINK